LALCRIKMRRPLLQLATFFGLGIDLGTLQLSVSSLRSCSVSMTASTLHYLTWPT
jgi:hypothetical protein